MFLDAEAERSERTYESTISDYQKGMIDMVREIYTNDTILIVNQKVKE